MYVGMPTSSPTLVHPGCSASTTNEHLKAYHGLALRGPRGIAESRSAPHVFPERAMSLESGVGVSIIPENRSDYSIFGNTLDSHSMHLNARGKGDH